MRKHFSLLLIVALVCMSAQAQTRYVGGDISMLPKYEKYNSPYKDANSKNIQNLLTWFIYECGWNTFRVRLFVNPDGSDPSVCQDLAYVTSLGKRIKEQGAYFMLDFHYSDTWVDASHIQAPTAWKNASSAAKADSIGAYTRRVLTALNEAGATPDLIQVGNEIMYGLCGIKVSPYDNSATDANWPAYINLLKAGCSAVREICPNAQIIIHTDRPNEVKNTKYYYTKLINNEVDFDVIGLSYYPFWHGYLTSAQSTTNLVSSIQSYSEAFPNKRIQIVEFAYNFQWWPSSGVKYDTQNIWPCSKKGQYAFVKDIVDNLKPLNHLDGISYWFPEEAGNGDNGSVIPSWLNRGFWAEEQSNTGHAINRTGQISNGQTAADVCAPYYMRQFYNSTEAIETIPVPARTQTRKMLQEGRLVLIHPDGFLFAPDGSRLR